MLIGDPSASEIISTLRAAEPELRARGVSHAALFGSRVRGNNRPDSDIDILIQIDPKKSIGVFDYVGIIQYIEDLFAVPVDVANREALKPGIRTSAEETAVDAF